MTTKNFSNLYLEVLKANDELLSKEMKLIKNSKAELTKLNYSEETISWKKYIDAMASLRDNAVKVENSISIKAEGLYSNIEEKVKSFNQLFIK